MRRIRDEKGITPDDAGQIVTRCADHDGSPEAALWLAVLNRALLDTWVAGECDRAKRFIESRRAEMVCDLSGVDIDFFRDVAKRIMPIPAAIVARWRKAKEVEQNKAKAKRKARKRGTP